MMEWWNNDWVVRIVGGILSGTVVAFISKIFLSKRDNREYAQKLISANREIIYAIRPGISEDIIPSNDVVQALIIASARRYGVDVKDLYNASEIAQELVKEVMDSSFISAKVKEDYCIKLNQLTFSIGSEIAESTNIESIKYQISQPANLVEYRERMVTLVSLMFGILTASMTLLLAFLQFKDTPLMLTFLSPEKTALLLPTVFAAVTVVALTSSLSLLSRLLEKREKYKEKNELIMKATSMEAGSDDIT